MTIHKTLYSLDYVGTPCQAEPDIWIRANDNEYAYVTVYVDDLAFAIKDPSKFLKELKTKYGFKLRSIQISSWL